jgi:hypothetical protein
MFKFIGYGNRHLAASCGSLFIGTFMLCGIIEIVVMPNRLIATSERERTTINRSIVPINLIAGESGSRKLVGWVER